MPLETTVPQDPTTVPEPSLTAEQPPRTVRKASATVPRGLVLAGALASSLLFGGCDRLALLLGITDPFADYRDSSVNFIAASGLDQQDLATGAANLLDPGLNYANPGYLTPKKWTWAWRGATDAGDSTGFSYMDLTLAGTVGAGAPTGLDPNAAVYSLKLNNLMPGGDFEGLNNTLARLTSNGWTWPPTATSPPDLGSWAIHGTSLNFNNPALIPTNTVGFRFDLSQLLDKTFSTVQHSYQLRFFALDSFFASQLAAPPADRAVFSTYTVDLDTLPATTEVNTLTDLVLPDLTFNPAIGADLVFGIKETPSYFVIDDLRMLRSDIVGEYRLRLLLAPTDTTPALTHGQGWVFSVWARKPPALSFVNEASAAEPYAARSITLRIRQVVKSGSNSDLDSSAETYSIEANPGWTRHILSLQPAGTLDFPTDSTVPVLELSITPFDEAAPEPGVVEIAAPELHFNLNG